MGSTKKDTDNGFFSNLGKRLRTDKEFARIFYIVAVVFVLAVVVIIATVFQGREDEKAGEELPADEQSVEAGDAATTDAAEPDYTLPEVSLEENAYADVNELVNHYFDAVTNGDSATIASFVDATGEEELIKIEKESAYIDEFDNVKVYTKPGPLPDSYIAFVYYEIKFTNINTLAPALTTLYVRPGEDGSLYICDGGMTAQDTDYIKSMVGQEDVADLFTMVQTKYEEAVDADADLGTFMAGLDAKLKAEVTEAMAQSQPQTEEPEEEAPQKEPIAENVVEEKVKATDTVNVRSSDSENADRIGQVAMGETITRYEQKENGWSRVDYNGTEGFIKSEFLQPVETAGTENSAVEEMTEESVLENTATEDSAPTTGITERGSVTIKETVNVRKSASQDAEKLGVAYQGEHYELIMEQADGWCKIKFNGQTGYVKTEFVE